ncbi:MAG: choice-of-anchor E domain-containing protein, partial [Planctomycetota bacterium]
MPRLPILRGLALLALGWTGTASSAHAQQMISFTDSIPLMTTSWTDEVEVPRFDPDLGILKSVRVTLNGSIIGSSAFESLDNKPTTVNTTFSATMSLFRPGGTSQITTIAPSQNSTDMVTAFDGVNDFGGTSGQVLPNLNVSESRVYTAPPPLSDLALFTGPAGNPGTIVLPVVVVGTSTGSGAGNLILSFSQQASADVEVLYTYNL